MKIHDKIRDEKHNTILAKKQKKTSALSSSKTYKYEYLIDKEHYLAVEVK